MSTRPVIGQHLAAHIDADAWVSAIRGYIDHVREYLHSLHGEKSAARVVNAAHSDLIDELIRALYDRAVDVAGERTRRRGDALSVLAVGGYARQEMAIYSDIDLLFLHARRPTPWAKTICEKMQYWLWDSGLQVGSATRDARETRRMATQDGTVRTALLDARVLAGEAQIGDVLREKVRKDVGKHAASLIQARMDEIRDRHARYEESIYLLQPNLKEGAGGLRDYHAACWATVAAFGTEGSLEALARLKLLTDAEEHDYREALDFMWRVRNELHIVSGRKHDQMSFELQDRIAREWGYVDDERALPVERFMQDYYRHVRVVRNLSELVLGQCLAKARGPRARRVSREAGDGFRIVEGHLEIPSLEHLREKPARLLSAFFVAQQEDVALSRTAQRFVRESLDLVDEAYCSHPENTAQFLAILEAEHRVMRTLMIMNEVGLLGAFLPEWQHIVCRWQQVLYHTYTVDVHSIFLVEELRRLWKNEYRAFVPDLTALVQNEVPDKAVLYLGCLLHDIGKGLGGDHSDKGFDRARRTVERLGLSPVRAARVCYLVKHHLFMSHVAQRRDLSDPKLIVEFARQAGDRENLRNLYLLTFADIRASSPKAWTEWKGFLLRELFERTSEYLEAGGQDPQRAFEQIQGRVDVRRDAARKDLRSAGVADSRVDEFFDVMPQRYFVSHTPRQIGRHAMVVFGLKPGELMATAVRAMRGDFSEFIVCTQDVPRLYSTVAGALTAGGINILGSHVYTTRSGLALEVYRVTTPAGGEEEQEIAWDYVRRTLRSALEGTVDVGEMVHQRRNVLGQPSPPVASPQSVLLSNSESDFYTIIDVAANDRQGLLYDLTRTVADLGHEVFISKAATILDQVTDTFYLKDHKGNKITDPAELDRLERAVQSVLEHSPDATP
ncbi:MAG: [protein-PII] uridylyltransferase [Deltaproteobacteria bacterium]|nr:[protein-PII] uridylyltransferase [Deltaproteobacteria bacterium]